MNLAKMDFQFRLDASGVSDGDAIFLSDFIRCFGWSRLFLISFIKSEDNKNTIFKASSSFVYKRRISQSCFIIEEFRT